MLKSRLVSLSFCKQYFSFCKMWIFYVVQFFSNRSWKYMYKQKRKKIQLDKFQTCLICSFSALNSLKWNFSPSTFFLGKLFFSTDFTVFFQFSEIKSRRGSICSYVRRFSWILGHGVHSSWAYSQFICGT